MTKLITAEKIKDLTGIQQLVPDYKFEHLVVPLFTKYFKEVLNQYYDTIFAKIGTNTNFTNTELAIIAKFEQSLAYYVLAETLFSIHFTIGKNGVNTINASEYSSVSAESLKMLKQSYFEQAQELRLQFIQWMNSTYGANNQSSERLNRRTGGFVFNHPNNYPYNNCTCNGICNGLCRGY